jgi:molybdopterin-biosynthesis enzyme MoeA-like protein
MNTTASTACPPIGLIIIGDEILSGKRQDGHFAKVRELLAARGLGLAWVRYLGDDRAQCEAALRESFGTDHIVFSCGGIGATPDDHTRQSAAAALGVPLELHPEAERLIAERTREWYAKDPAAAGSPDMSTPENQQRLNMGKFPAGANIIPNPYNKIPGFNVGQHWFVPGFPVMAWPMIEWVLDTHYKHFHNQVQLGEKSFLVYGVPESRATPLMEAVEAEFAGIKVFSLPSVGNDKRARHIELGVKGPVDALPAAYARLLEGTQAICASLGGEIDESARRQ